MNWRAEHDVERAIRSDMELLAPRTRRLLVAFVAMACGAILGFGFFVVAGVVTLCLGISVWTLRRSTRAAQAAEWFTSTARFVCARNPGDTRLYFMRAESGIEGVRVRDAHPSTISPQDGTVHLAEAALGPLVVLPGVPKIYRVKRFELSAGRRAALEA